MTIPWMMNCSHMEEGWCLDCTSELGNELWKLQDELKRLQNNLTKISTYGDYKAWSENDINKVCEYLCYAPEAWDMVYPSEICAAAIKAVIQIIEERMKEGGEE